MKNKYPVYILLMAVVPLWLLLSGCPNNKESATNKTASSSKAISLLDSAVLIKQLAYLSSAEMAGRESGTPGNKLAQDYILKIFDSLQLNKLGNSYLQPFTFGSGQQGANVMGYYKGSIYPHSFIVITAHYDHVGVHDGKIYYGTDDNASGSSALLTMMRYFKQHLPKHSLLFIACDAEEKGLQGSKYFVSHSPLPLKQFIANLNMDMVSRNDSNQIYVCGTFHYPFLKKYVETVASQTPVHIKFGHDDASKGGTQDWTSQSDHFPFHQNHIPFLYFGVEDHPDYHQPGDTFDKVNKQFYFQVCNAITALVVLLDQQPSLQ